MKRVEFSFDERSAVNVESLRQQGLNLKEFTVRDPDTGEQRQFIIPVEEKF